MAAVGSAPLTTVLSTTIASRLATEQCRRDPVDRSGDERCEEAAER